MRNLSFANWKEENSSKYSSILEKLKTQGMTDEQSVREIKKLILSEYAKYIEENILDKSK